MAQLYPYFNFENTKETLDHYEEIFGAVVISRMIGQQAMLDKMGIAIDADKTTMHAIFEIQGNRFMASDSFGKSSTIGDGLSMMLDYNSEDAQEVEEMNKLYDRVVKNGESNITMPMAQQFWGGSMAIFTDKYDVTWMLHAQPYSKMK